MLVTFALAGVLLALAFWAFIEAASAIAAGMLIVDGRLPEAQGRSSDSAFTAGVCWAILSVAGAFSAGVLL